MIKFLISTLSAVVFCSSCTFKRSRSEIKNVNGMQFSSLSLKNKLEVLLVSDIRFKKSSAAVAVGVGSLEDPRTMEGMAHYLEHMLFMGTKEYPDHDEYSKYIKTHGGSNNAYTSSEVTNYYFEIDHPALEGGVRRFSRFFVSPLFNKTYLEKEKNAVNSEFNKNIKNDWWRLSRFISSLSDKKHPNSKFSIGNTKTLSSVKREDVINFYRKYYSANNMKLVVMSNRPLVEMESIVKNNFSDVPNFNIKRPSYEDLYFRKEEVQRTHFVKSIKDQEGLHIIFDIPNEVDYWQSKPAHIIASLIGDEGRGSLLSYLRSKGWALGVGSSTAGYWRSFSISVTLTPEGRKNYQEVIKSIFAYISFIKKKGYPEYYYQDNKMLSELDLKNLEPNSSGGAASHFAASMMEYPADEFLDRQFLLSAYSQDDFNHFLSYMSLEKAHVIISSNKEEVDSKEPIFGVAYRSVNEKIALDEISISEVEKNFSYPKKNHYIADDFSLVSAKRAEVPRKIQLSNKAELFLQVDTEMEIPRGFASVIFYSDIDNSPRNTLLGHLYSMVKQEELREWGYPILTARYNYDLYSNYADTMSLDASGYSQNIIKLLKSFVFDEANNKSLTKVSLDRNLFNKMKEKVKKDLKNRETSAAYQRLYSEYSILSRDKGIHWREYINMIDGVSLQDLQLYATTFFSKIYIKFVYYGNVEERKAREFVDYVFSKLSSKKLDQSLIEKKRSRYRVVPGGKKYSLKVEGKNNNNGLLTIYNAGPWTISNHAKSALVGEIISQPYFAELRSNQQLGYVVRMSPSTSYGYTGLIGVIQSQKYSVQSLQKKSDIFVLSYLKKMSQKLTEEELAPVREAMINELVKAPNSMGERFSLFKQRSLKYEGQFDVNLKLASELKKIKADDLKAYVRDNYLKKAPSRLNLYYLGQGTKRESGGLPGVVFEKVSAKQSWDTLNPYK